MYSSRVIIPVISADYLPLSYHLALLSARLDPNSACPPAPLKAAVPADGYLAYPAGAKIFPLPLFLQPALHPPSAISVSFSFSSNSHGCDPAHLSYLAFLDPQNPHSATFIPLSGTVSELTRCHPHGGADLSPFRPSRSTA